MPSLGSRGCPPCSPAPPSPRLPLPPRMRRLRSRRSLSPSPPAPSRNKAPPGGVGNLHHRPRFELQHPKRVEGRCRPSCGARIRRSVFLVAAARVGGGPFPRAAFSGLPYGYVAGYARRRRAKGRELATHGSDGLKSGALQKAISAFIEKFKPEATYFGLESGQRTAFSSSQWEALQK